MKTKIPTALLLFICFLFIGSLHSYSQTDSTQVLLNRTDSIQYTCSMHPEVVSDKPGKCPTCGMELIRMEKGKIQTEPEPHQMDMMMCPMHGMMGMDHKHNDQKNHNRKWLRPAGIAMGAMMVAMIIIVGSR